MKAFAWVLLFIVGINASLAASNDPNVIPQDRYTVTTARADDVFHRQLDPASGQCCGMCTQLILNPDIVSLLVAFGVEIGGQLNPFILAPSAGIIVIMRITMVYTDNNASDKNLQVTKTFDVEILPDAWKEPCSYTDDCIIFENDEVLMFAPPTVGGFAVLSLESVNEFTETSDVNIISSSCDLRCADADVCDTYEPSVGDLEPSGSGIPFGVIEQSQFNNGFCNPRIFDDPHVTGLRGQRYDWSGEDGGWYAFLSTDRLQMNLRVTSYLPTTFPDRQLVTGVALIMSGGHSVTVEVAEPLKLSPSCEDGFPVDNGTQAPCLINGALRITVDGNEEVHRAGEFLFDGDIDITAVNLPLECQRFGDHRMWAELSDEQKLMDPEKRMLRAHSGATGISSIFDWLMTNPAMIAAPWCQMYAKRLADDVGQLARLHSDHAVLRINSPELALRVNVGINSEEEQILPDGRTVPAARFWQMDVSVEHAVGLESADGMLGETSRRIYDQSGKPVMSGLGVLHGGVEDYRVMHPLGAEFKQLFVRE